MANKWSFLENRIEARIEPFLQQLGYTCTYFGRSEEVGKGGPGYYFDADGKPRIVIDVVDRIKVVEQQVQKYNWLRVLIGSCRPSEPCRTTNG